MDERLRSNYSNNHLPLIFSRSLCIEKYHDLVIWKLIERLSEPNVCPRDITLRTAVATSVTGVLGVVDHSLIIVLLTELYQGHQRSKCSKVSSVWKQSGEGHQPFLLLGVQCLVRDAVGYLPLSILHCTTALVTSCTLKYGMGDSEGAEGWAKVDKWW